MKLHVDMFGDFVIYVDGAEAFRYEGRTRKLWNLLQYFLINRNRKIPQAELFSIAHLRGNSVQQENSLKNLIYRLRHMLEESNLPKVEYIICEKSVYSWNPDVIVILDCEILEQEYRTACEDTQNQEKQLVHYMAAIEQYRGNFLPQSQDEEWIKELSQKYHAIFCECMKKTYHILQEKKNLDCMEDFCRHAVKMNPEGEEEICLYIELLMYKNQCREAMELYTAFSKRLLKEHDCVPSPKAEELYHKIIQRLNHVQTDINIVESDLKKANIGYGPYYCQYEIFKNMYRLLSGVISKDNSLYLLLFTIVDAQGKLPGVKLLHAGMRFLQLAIGKTLNCGDVYAQYNATQYVVMLRSDTEENTKILAERILNNYSQLYPNKKVVANVAYQSLNPTEQAD